jgi:hypothetical protein
MVHDCDGYFNDLSSLGTVFKVKTPFQQQKEENKQAKRSKAKKEIFFGEKRRLFYSIVYNLFT